MNKKTIMTNEELIKYVEDTIAFSMYEQAQATNDHNKRQKAIDNTINNLQTILTALKIKDKANDKPNELLELKTTINELRDTCQKIKGDK